jgi:hypothetical protein
VRTHRLVVAACRLALAVTLGALLAAPGASYAQDDPPWDEALDTPLFLIHIIRTSSITGDIDTDQYIVHHSPPDGEGNLVLPDGFGGTFGNKSDWSGGPYGTARAVCTAARSQGESAFSFQAGANFFSCSTLAPSGNWFSRLGTGGKVLVIGTGILVAVGVAVAVGAGVAAAVSAVSAAAGAGAAALNAFAGELITTWLAGKALTAVAKRLALQAGKQLFKKLGRKASQKELYAAMLAAINAQLAARGMAPWAMEQLETLLWGIDLVW